MTSLNAHDSPLMEILSLSLVYDAQDLKGNKWLCLYLNSGNLNSSSSFPLNYLAAGAELIRHFLTWDLVLSTFKLPCIFLLGHLFLTLLSQSPPTKTVSQVAPLLEGLIHHAFVYSFSKLFSSVQFSHSIVSDSLRPQGLQHARLPCPSPTPRACSNSCPSSW